MGARYSSPQSLSCAGTSRAGHVLQRGQRARVAAHLDALGREHRADARQERRRLRGVHQQRLGGVAGAVLLRLGVVGDAHRQLEVDALVDVGVAVAVQVLDDGHAGLARDALDQALAAARDDHVDELGHRDQPADGGAVGGLDQLHRRLGQARVGQRALHAAPQRDVGADRLGAAAQDARVAALDGQRRGLDRDVGAALVDHAEHAQRHAHAAHADAAGALRDAGDLADRVGHLGQLQAAFDDGGRAHARPGAGDRAAGRRGRCRRRRAGPARWPSRARAPASRRRAASARRAASRLARGEAAMRAAAARAAAPSASRVAATSVSVMRRLSVSAESCHARARFRVSASVGSPRRRLHRRQRALA